MRFDRYEISKAARALIVFGLAGVAGCDNGVTGPDRSSLWSRPRVPLTAQHESHPGESIGLYTVSFTPVDTFYASATNDTSVVLPRYEHPTVVKVEASGLMYRVSRYPQFFGDDQWGPCGRTSLVWDDGVVHNNQVAFSCSGWGPATAYVSISGLGQIVAASRAIVAPKTIDGLWVSGVGRIYCGVAYHVSCHTITGSPAMTITRLDGDMTLTVDSSSLKPGSTARFTTSVAPVDGHALFLEEDSVAWIPDGANAGGERTDTAVFQGACTFVNHSCTRRIIGSGTLVVGAWVNGKYITKSAYVSTPALAIKAVQTNGAVGRTVSFTATWTDESSAQNPIWHWTPDSLPGQTVACAQAVNPCDTIVYESGTMSVAVSRGGVTRTAEVHVTVTPCATGDNVLDDPVVRQALDSIWRLSNPLAQPTSLRIETSASIYDSSGVTIFRVTPRNSQIDGPCSSAPATVYSGLGTLLAVVHTHPGHVAERIQCTPTRSKVYAAQYGGPSPNDWAVSTTSLFGPVPNYVADARKVYRMTNYPSTSDYWQAAVDPFGSPILDSQGNQIFVPTRWHNSQYFNDFKRNLSSCSLY